MKHEWIINSSITCSTCPHIWVLRSNEELTEETVRYWVLLAVQQHENVILKGDYGHEM